MVNLTAANAARPVIGGDYRLLDGPGAGEIVPGDAAGGANTSHTIMVDAFAALVSVVPREADYVQYERTAVDENMLGKRTDGARRRTFRYLRELYLLRPDAVLFRALRDLWETDVAARPLLAGLCALARDPVFRASSSAITRASLGEPLASHDLADAVSERYPESYNDSTLAKIGRNTFSSWQQTGHLSPAARGTKTRVQVTCRPANVAYALLLGHLQGVRGQPLFETLWAEVLDQPPSALVDMARTATQLGMIEMRNAGGVIEVGFRELLRPFDRRQGRREALL